MKNLIREFFFLRKGERRALVFVAFILFCTIGFRFWVDYKPRPEKPLNPEYFLKMKEIQDSMLKEISKSEKVDYYEKSWKKEEKEEKELLPFPFNPNTISKDSLFMMNISGYVANNIVRYRDAGGKFSSSEELKKIYGLEQEDFDALMPFVRISRPDSNRIDKIAIQIDSVPMIELNGADTLQLMTIPGIGPSFSRRILKYRSILGGYYSRNQLWEVYGMDSLRIKALKQFTCIDTSKIDQIPLNTASFKDLISRPFIDKSETYAILQYRDYVDSIKSISELELNQIIDHDRFIQMRPYLSLDETK
jgi:competence protein ComEA